jgi:hypothetical protein
MTRNTSNKITTCYMRSFVYQIQLMRFYLVFWKYDCTTHKGDSWAVTCGCDNNLILGFCKQSSNKIKEFLDP